MVMKEGKAIEIASCDQVLHHPRTDYARKLLESTLAI
jgi:ABC-type microcin C transport system duplicated ATPase subunit YejF